MNEINPIREAAREIIYQCGIGGYGAEMPDDHPLLKRAMEEVQKAVNATIEASQPKTADGVKLKLGMTVFDVDGYAYCVKGIVQQKTWFEVMFSEGGFLPSDDVYSSQKAAKDSKCRASLAFGP